MNYQKLGQFIVYIKIYQIPTTHLSQKLVVEQLKSYM